MPSRERENSWTAFLQHRYSCSLIKIIMQKRIYLPDFVLIVGLKHELGITPPPPHHLGGGRREGNCYVLQ
jgi:hypothetical protein